MSALWTIQTTSASAAAPVTTAYRAIGPTRLADTRPASHSGFVRLNDTTIRVPVDANADAAVLTITAVNTTDAGFVTVFPAGQPRPEASNVNIGRSGEVRANTVAVRLGADGAVDVFSDHKVDLIVDVVGLFEASSHATAGRYMPLPPGRLLDTRQPAFGASPVRAGQTRTIALPDGVPTDAQALAINLTFTDSAAAGFFTAWPAGAPRPQASTGNADAAKQARAIFTVVPVTAAGFSIYTESGAHLIVDVVGYFTGASAPDESEGLFVPHDPTRLLDTRTDAAGVVWPDGTMEMPGLDLAGHEAAWLNYTSIDAFVPGFVTAWPARTTKPNSSTLNATGPSTALANAAITNLSTAGIALWSSGGEHLLADLAGYFTGDAAPTTTVPAANAPPATFTFGRSAGGRPLVAHHRVGSAAADRTVLVIGSMHGEEPAGGRVVNALATATLAADLDLWTIDTLNPDGLAIGNRHNDHGIDLNRNWPGQLYPWAATTGYFASGSYPLSEPETQAMLHLVQNVDHLRPIDWAVSYHQPLDTVDCDTNRGATLMTACAKFATRVGTPSRPFIRVAGSMTDTMMAKGFGWWFTVEFGLSQPVGAEVALHVAAINLVGRD